MANEIFILNLGQAKHSIYIVSTVFEVNSEINVRVQFYQYPDIEPFFVPSKYIERIDGTLLFEHRSDTLSR